MYGMPKNDNAFEELLDRIPDDQKRKYVSE